MKIEVAYATPERQMIIPLDIPDQSTIEFAIHESGILKEFPEIDLTKNAVGIFSRRVKLDTVLQSDDRVEIYRSLLIDPKSQRRKRAQKKKIM
ncbi:MAG: RnfH family protein [Proteobacteria bacterium]|nr:RnfH family protein [Pseudomonadota bacterium]